MRARYHDRVNAGHAAGRRARVRVRVVVAPRPRGILRTGTCIMLYMLVLSPLCFVHVYVSHYVLNELID